MSSDRLRFGASLGPDHTASEMIEDVRESGLGAIGTADDAVAQIERLRDRSGGFGAYVTFLHEWANPAATLRSDELLAQRVMPEVQGHGPAGRAAAARAATRREELVGTVVAAHDAAVARHHAAP